MSKKLRSSVYETAGKICDEIGTELNVTYDADSKELIGELIWKKLQQYGSDLEAFMKHGKRSVINIDDVRLLVRNNESLKEIVEDKAKTMVPVKAESTGTRSKKRKIETVTTESENT